MDASPSWDPRTTPLRDGIASRALEGVARAEVYLDAKAMSCAVPAAGVHRAPDLASEQMDQILFGEAFEAIEEEGGFFWGQARRDGYVGFVAASALSSPAPEPTHRVSAVRTYAFAEPSIKSRAMGPYSMNALVAVEAQEGRLAKAAGGGWMAAGHLTPIGTFETDVAGVAERFLGAPYLWGGCRRRCSPAGSPVRGTPTSRPRWAARSVATRSGAATWCSGRAMWASASTHQTSRAGASSTPTASTWPWPSSPWRRRSRG
jgi:cell wall-associated NlpC family hydrolase